MPRSFLLLLLILQSTRAIATQITIEFDAIRFHGNALRDIRGTSVHWSDDGDGFRMSHTSGTQDANDSLVRSFRYNVLRIPGAWLSRFFDWRSASGAAYGMQRNYAGRPESVKTGLKELKQFAAKNEFRIMYTVNIDDPPERTAELIRVWNALPPADGPRIEWIELGNEVYDEDPTAAEANAYVRKIHPIIRALRAVKPKVKIGAIFANPVNRSWDTTVYTSVRREIDFFIWHRYGPYTDYYAPDSYSAAVRGFDRIDQDLRQLQTMLSGSNIPLFITEYNLSFYGSGKKHQSMPMEPRYYFLTANFITASVRNNVRGLVKHQLANAGWHVFADIDFMGMPIGVNSIGGMVTRQLNLWLERQDSVAVHYFPGYSPWECSLLIGKNNEEIEFLFQNHTADTLHIASRIQKSLNMRSYISYRQQGKELVSDRSKKTDKGFPAILLPFSIGFYRCLQE